MDVLPEPAAVLPHRSPFLFLDAVTRLEPGVLSEGRWTPGPEVPTVDVGVGPQIPVSLVLEAVAQLGAYGAILTRPEAGLPLFTQVGKARFRHAVRPGSTVDLWVAVERLHRRSGRGHGRASVDGTVAVEMTLGFVFVPLDQLAAPSRPDSGQ